jgi:hypothetical protein
LNLPTEEQTAMTDPNRPQFKLTAPDGSIIAVGDMAAVTEPILDSKSRRVAEHLVRSAALAAGRVAEIDRRADAVIEREREVAAAERALREDAVRRLCDSADNLARRLDAYEQAMVADALAEFPTPTIRAAIPITCKLRSNRRTRSTRRNWRRCLRASAKPMTPAPGPAICQMNFNCRQRLCRKNRRAVSAPAACSLTSGGSASRSRARAAIGRRSP